MFTKAVALSVLTALVTAAPQPITERQSSSGLSLTAQLQLSDLVTDRYTLLPNNSDFVYNFNNATAIFADRQSFPALVGTGAGMALARIPPCGEVTLHLHPRAAELFIVLNGTVITEMVPETFAVDAQGNQRVVRTNLTANMMTVFPQGSFHTQLNAGCETAVAVAGFSSDDPGINLIASSIFDLTDDVITRTFGGSISGSQIAAVRKAIPKGIASVTDCRKMCGMK